MKSISLEEFDAMYQGFADGGVNSEQYQTLSATVIDVPWASLHAMDPFSAAYKQRVLEIYVRLSGGQKSNYLPARDEKSGLNSPANIWMDLPPWSFRDPKFAAEFLLAWGHILSLMELGSQPGASVLEYGPGSGQLLLMLARMGVTACGVDIDPASVEIMRQQASVMDVPMQVEIGEFGGGFDGQTFDCVLFFESFHHSLEFLSLLPRLRERLKPGGRVILAGEPVVDEPGPVLPYPWGPRLDALSVFCIRHYGWMELGFTEAFLVEAFQRAGYAVSPRPFPGVGRAKSYVMQPLTAPAVLAHSHSDVLGHSDALGLSDVLGHDMPAAAGSAAPALEPAPPAEPAYAREPDLMTRLNEVTAHRDAMLGSTSWRVTAPLRALVRAARAGKLPGGVRRRSF